MSEQAIINLLQFLWATLHDFIYVGAFLIFRRLPWFKPKAIVPLERRVARIERILLMKYRRQKKAAEVTQ